MRQLIERATADANTEADVDANAGYIWIAGDLSFPYRQLEIACNLFPY